MILNGKKMITTIKLLELMSARMFHDLAGPIGAVNNSVEFLEEDNQHIKDKALKIIKSSASESIVRLKFFRQAYGTVGDKEVHLEDFIPLIKEFLISTKIKIECEFNSDAIDYYMAKVMLNLIIISSSCLIYGGVIKIIQLDNGIKILFQNENFLFNDDISFILNGDLSNITLSSANIQIYYTHLIIKEASATLTITKHKDELEFLIINQE